MKKAVLSILGVLALSTVLLGWYIVTPHSLPDQDSYWHKRFRSWHYSYLYRFSNDPIMTSTIHKSDIPLDIVIPMVEKDIPTAKYTIKTIRGLLMHPINKIYIVAPDSEKLRKFAHDQGVIFKDENDVLPCFSKTDKQRGWIKQQYLKLNSDSFVETENFLVIDADMMLLRAHLFIYKGKTLLNAYRDYSLERKQFVQEVLGLKKFYNLDFTAHHMLLNKQILKELKQDLEKKYNKIWYDALNDVKLNNVHFSEYELYANYVLDRHPKKFKIVHGRFLNLERNKLPGVNFIQGAYSSDYKVLSSHHFYLM